jgi:hypothetical protein
MRKCAQVSIFIIVPLSFMVALILLAGCGGGGGGCAPPAVVVSNASATPSLVLPGNTVTIQADISAIAGIASVSAGITKPDGSIVIPISMVLKAGTTDTYVATYGHSPGQMDEPGDYSVSVTATDANSNSVKSSTFKFAVESPPLPPPP